MTPDPGGKGRIPSHVASPAHPVPSTETFTDGRSRAPGSCGRAPAHEVRLGRRALNRRPMRPCPGKSGRRCLPHGSRRRWRASGANPTNRGAAVMTDRHLDPMAGRRPVVVLSRGSRPRSPDALCIRSPPSYDPRDGPTDRAFGGEGIRHAELAGGSRARLPASVPTAGRSVMTAGHRRGRLQPQGFATSGAPGIQPSFEKVGMNR